MEPIHPEPQGRSSLSGIHPEAVHLMQQLGDSMEGHNSVLNSAEEVIEAEEKVIGHEVAVTVMAELAMWEAAANILQEPNDVLAEAQDTIDQAGLVIAQQEILKTAQATIESVLKQGVRGGGLPRVSQRQAFNDWQSQRGERFGRSFRLGAKSGLPPLPRIGRRRSIGRVSRQPDSPADSSEPQK